MTDLPILVPSANTKTRMTSLINNGRLVTVARIWVLMAAVALAVEFFGHGVGGLTNGGSHPLGHDFINSWSGAKLALMGRFGEVYDFTAFHVFQESVVGDSLTNYHYSYPPTMALLTIPFGALPYIPSLVIWLVGGTVAYAMALRGAWAPAWPHWVLFAGATPALFLSLQAGQTGAWTAALLGGGLCALYSRPIFAGILIGLLVAKPQLGLLVPFALAAGGHWRAFAAASLTVVLLVAMSIGFFGIESWQAYFARAELLSEAVLEGGIGVWHRFVSIFVAARRFGADPSLAYSIQAVVAVAATLGVTWVWRSRAPTKLKYAILVVGGFLATPYLQDYDLVVATFVVAWALQASERTTRGIPTKAELFGYSGLILLPIVTASIGKLTGLSLGGPVLVLVFLLLLRSAIRATPPEVPVDG